MRALGLVVLFSALVAPIQLQPQAGSATEIVISNVTVVPGDGSPTLPSQTVLIRGERIAAIGPTDQVAIPQGATLVDGTGRFLMPGLIDLHVHVSKTRSSALGLFVVNGVTTVRDMGGDFEELLRWRGEVDAGSRVGPRMVIAGPYLESARNIARMRKDPPEARVEPFERTRVAVGSPADARRIVADLASREVDFLKIRTIENDETYRALNDAAQTHGLRLVGHVYGISPKAALDAGQDGIEHNFYPSLDRPDERMAVWRQFAARGVACVPTLVTMFEATFPPIGRLKAVVDDETATVDPRRAYLSRFLVLDWREQVAEASVARTETLRKVYNEVVRRDLREMHQAGMDVLAGSDSAVLNIFPGSSLHDELALMVREIGMTASETIARSTGRAAASLGLADSIGTVKRGKVADLWLLDADPTVEIANTRRIASVFVLGRHYAASDLDRVREAVKSAQDRRVNDWVR